MKLTIDPTDQIIRIEGQDFRVWTGADEEGVPVQVFVRGVSPQTDDEHVAKRFMDQLKELPPLRSSGLLIEYRFVVDDAGE